ncbi:MAG: septum formation protein Maf [Oligoflexia bacterium]|nr:septum formation protein Maf [Oligoflexia bacterium]MBF0365115.1 septum formation protein Maf [Oligoflexia bacterium]
MTTKYSLILASLSPRRNELLGWTEVPFAIKSMQIPEQSSFSNPSEVVMDLAKQKGLAVYKELTGQSDFATHFFPVVVGSDTIVVVDGEILGRPQDELHAREMLRKLSNKTHLVLTGVYIGLCDRKSKLYREEVFYEETKVTFDEISDDLLDVYVKTADPLDKAGAYGIQGPALTFISRVEGSYSNVVGFPLSHFVRRLKTFIAVDDDGDASDARGNGNKHWREVFSGDTFKG